MPQGPNGRRSVLVRMVACRARTSHGALTTCRVGNGLTAKLMAQVRCELAPFAIGSPAADVDLMAQKRRASSTWLQPIVVVEK